MSLCRGSPQPLVSLDEPQHPSGWGFEPGFEPGIFANLRTIAKGEGAIKSLKSRGGWVPSFFEFFAYRTHAQLRDNDVSTKPVTWTGRLDKEDEELAQVIGARLTGRDLRYAQAQGAFLAKALLVGADLRGADLREADLRGGFVDGARFEGADLCGADLRGVEGLTNEQRRAMRTDQRSRFGSRNSSTTAVPTATSSA